MLKIQVKNKWESVLFAFVFIGLDLYSSCSDHLY